MPITALSRSIDGVLDLPVASWASRSARAGLAALSLVACDARDDTGPILTLADPPTLPEMRLFDIPDVAPSQRSNTQIAQDFLDLFFMLESGRVLERFTRFEKPITLRVTGDNPPPTLHHDLQGLITRLHRESDLDITQVTANQSANITIELLAQAKLQAAVPQAACFVVPRVDSWAAFENARGSELLDWSNLERRETLAIFVPNNVSPQELRDCLHEELAQSLGPLNDLYRLPDSVFNDDNIHAILTGFDMLILRAAYAPDLKSGMSRAEVAARLPGILARINPRGERAVTRRLQPSSRAWINAIETVFAPKTARARREAAARRAIGLAKRERWRDHRLAYAYTALGRITLGYEPQTALNAFMKAADIYGQQTDTTIHEAHIALQLAAFTMSLGQTELTISLIEESLPVAHKAQNAALMASMGLMLAQAYDLENDTARAKTARIEALSWARYGFGSDAEVYRRMAEIAALAPGATFVSERKHP